MEGIGYGVAIILLTYLMLRGKLKVRHTVYKVTGIIVVVIIIGNVKVQYKTTEVFTESIEKEWDIDLPQTYTEDKVVRYRGFYGNGVSYIVLKYINKEEIESISKLVKWRVKDGFVQEQIRECLRFLEEWYDVTIEERNDLLRYTSKLGGEYEYYYTKQRDNMSYGVFVWFKDEGEIHAIEMTY